MNDSPKLQAKPTKVRHVVVAATALMAVLLYLDRFCISFAEIFIKEDLGLTDSQVGIMLGSFFFSYALAQVPSGWLSDRFGARIMLTAYIVTWSLFTGLTGAATTFVVLIVLRLGFGVGQAGAYPTSASIVSKWVPFSNRGMASSLIAVGGRVGGAIAPVLTAMLILLFVPLSVDSKLKPHDVMDAPRLAHEILHGSSTAPDEKGEYPQDNLQARVGARILSLQDSEGRPLIDSSTRAILRENSTSYSDAAQEQSEADAENNEETGAEKAAPAAPPLTQGQTQELRTALNRVINSPDLYDEETFADVSVEKEAKQLLNLRKNGDELSTAQLQRLNRLLLEGVYRDSIRKVYAAGWRQVMFVYGGIGCLIAGIFWVVFRNHPSVHPWVNRGELEEIEHGRPASSPKSTGSVSFPPMMNLLTSRSMWLVCVAQWCTNVGWVFLVTWLPRYLENVHNVPVAQRAFMTFVPAAVGWFGMLFGGRLTDTLTRNIGLRWGRGLPMSLSRFTAMGAYLAVLAIEPSAWWTVALFSVVAFSTDLGTPAVWAFKQDVGGRYVGSILGWGNMWGNFGAAVAPWFMIWVVNDVKTPTWLNWLVGSSQEQNWELALLTCALAFFLAGIAAAGVDATIPIAPQDEE